jgi:hypothetical protein
MVLRTNSQGGDDIARLSQLAIRTLALKFVGIVGLPPNIDFGLWGRSCIGKLAKLCKVDNFANIATLWILSETRMLQALVAPRPNSQDERRFERM